MNNNIKENYHKLMLKEIEDNVDGLNKPRLLLHSCCAPCSSYVITFLSEYFNMEIFFYNPNIYPEKEYIRRMKEQIRLVEELGFDYKVIENDHDSNLFYDRIKGLESLGEGSIRCSECFRLRLGKTAEYAQSNDFDYWTTTLTISPMKNSQVLNAIGVEMERRYGAKFLVSDFKKNNGYKVSTDLSKKYKLYRQDYCGCVFSQNEREKR